MKTKKMYKRSRLSLPVTGALGIFCLLTIACTSCRNEEPVDMDGPGKQVTITMSVPGVNPADGPVTYAMPTDEATVNTVDVLCFQTDPAGTTDVDKGTFLYRASVGHTAGATTFKVILAELDVNPAVNQTLVVLANCRPQVETLMGSISAGATKASVISSLVLTQSTAFDASAMTGIPMWGEITNQPVRSGYNPGGLNVFLTRMLAKIDITNSEALFDLQEAYLYNPRQKGSIIPDNWTGTDVTSPSNVAGAQMTQKTRFGPFTTLTEAIADQIFTFEADNAAMAGADLLDATCLVVGGKYNGSPTNSYYRVDLKNYATNAFYDVKRNYSYNVIINKIDFEGTETPGAAFEGQATIQATVEAWNDRNASVTAGQYHLKVSAAEFNVSDAAGTEPLSVFTDYPGGWEVAKIVDGADQTQDITWLTSSETEGDADNTTNTTLAFEANAGAARTGKIHLVAGDMTLVVTVNQDGLLPQPTSNSYIVAPMTNNFTIPVLRCNQSDLGAQLATGEAFTAELVWTDNANGIATDSNIKDIRVVGAGLSGYLVVSTGSAQGNAVVCIKNSSNQILWSWHIWVTNYDPETGTYVSNGQTFMERNLGAMNNTKGDPGSLGLLYQWGRKDPFPGSTSNTSATEPTYATVTKTKAPAGSPPNYNIGVSVANPLTFYYGASTSNDDWYCGNSNVHNDGLWMARKTVYDPCPVGWRVPDSDIPLGSPWKELPTRTFVAGEGPDWTDIGQGYYPAAIVRGERSGDLSSTQGGRFGNYSTSTQQSTAGSFYRLLFSSGDVKNTFAPLRATGMSIRCVRE